MGSLDSALSVLDEMEKVGLEPDLITFNTLPNAFYQNENRMSEAVELIDEMKTSGIKPDVFTLNSLMKGFCNAGNLEEAKRWYSEIARNELPPVRATYMTLIPFLVEKGDFELCKEVCSRRWLIEPALLQ
ncbi:pentatricopeptide repeat-containing protein At1g55890, mitochondrial-like [Vitis riparia]|uniref:pentatricopeptide repeat-containing protein At1g55890, mitochondrial-like n=1 Tax=Vitis riparia TaxID=96939 RepID=UPI00155A1A58|nr:pentatricopeptide repeat-containing protein At1g55890, mitochondrial-like [Vitis riparia]